MWWPGNHNGGGRCLYKGGRKLEDEKRVGREELGSLRYTCLFAVLMVCKTLALYVGTGNCRLLFTTNLASSLHV